LDRQNAKIDFQINLDYFLGPIIILITALVNLHTVTQRYSTLLPLLSDNAKFNLKKKHLSIFLKTQLCSKTLLGQQIILQKYTTTTSTDGSSELKKHPRMLWITWLNCMSDYSD
jgi:hypothetical protein